MSKIVVVACALLLGLACIVADVTSRRLKKLEAQFARWENAEYYALKADLRMPNETKEQLIEAIVDLQQRTDNLEDSNCCCPSPIPCTCYPPKQVETKPPPVSKFCRFAMIQIDGVAKTAWFKWLDIDGVEHETRMSLSEFETWGTSQK